MHAAGGGACGPQVLFRHRFLNFIGGARQAMAQHNKFAVLSHSKHIFNADAQPFFRNVNSGLQREYHAFVDRHSGIVGIMHVQAHVMSQSMDEIFSKRLAVDVFAVRVDVIKGDFIKRIRISAAGGELGLPCLESLHGGFL